MRDKDMSAYEQIPEDAARAPAPEEVTSDEKKGCWVFFAAPADGSAPDFSLTGSDGTVYKPSMVGIVSAARVNAHEVDFDVRVDGENVPRNVRAPRERVEGLGETNVDAFLARF